MLLSSSMFISQTNFMIAGENPLINIVLVSCIVTGSLAERTLTLQKMINGTSIPAAANLDLASS